jgi:hypothetical protein
VALDLTELEQNPAAANPARVLSLIGEVRELEAENKRLRKAGLEAATIATDLLAAPQKADPWAMKQHYRERVEAARRALAGES